MGTWSGNGQSHVLGPGPGPGHVLGQGLGRERKVGIGNRVQTGAEARVEIVERVGPKAYL